MNFENDGPTRERRTLGLWCHAALLCGLLCSTTAMAEDRNDPTPRNLGDAALRQVSLAGNGAGPLSVGLDAVPLLESNPDGPLGGPAANDFGASRWGPRRGLTDTSALAPRGANGASLYAYVDLGSALPARLRELIGQPDGGVTMDLRGSSSAFSGPSMGSMMRWNNRDGSQLSLRLRRGKLSLQYGLRFWH
ncbi:hypothetical protein [Leptothrix cholodnii]|nr:hypothetical protein [Leptothrix cholodnii]